MRTLKVLRKARKSTVYKNSSNDIFVNFPADNVKKKINYNFGCPLLPFLKSLSLYGIYIQQSGETDNKYKKLFRFLHVAIIFVPLHYWALLYLSYFIRNEATWKNFTQALVVWTTAATYDIVLIMKKKIQQFVRIICSDKTFNDGKSNKVEYLKKACILNIAIWFYILAWSATILGIPSTRKPKNHFTEFFFENVVKKTSHQFGKFLIQVNDAYFCLIVEGSLSLTVGFYITAVYACGVCFNKIAEEIRHFVMFGNLSISQVKHFHQVFNGLTHRVNLIDNTFSVAVLLWHLMVTLTLCFRVIDILGDNHKPEMKGMIVIGFGVFRGISLIMVMISFTAQYMTDSATNAVLEVATSSALVQNCIAYRELTILVRRMELKPPTVTLWKFCTIGKPFLLSCIQTIITYVIICLQMTPAGKTLLHI